MMSPTLQFPGPALEFFAIANDAIGQLPPAFPLAATVAVNPYMGQTAEPREVAAARLARVAGIRIARPRADLLAMYEEGRLTDADLGAAATDGLTLSDLRAALAAPEAALHPLPTVADLATGAAGVDWSEMVEDRIGCWAAAHFDEGQAFWPALGGGPYQSWRKFASRDLSPGIAGLDRFAEEVATLPTDPRAAFALACETLQLTTACAPLYLHRLLMTLGGWAQYARHFGWLAERDGGQDDTAFELLTIRLLWDALLLTRQSPEVQADWTVQLAAYAEPVVPSHEDRVAIALQEAADRANERALAAKFDGTATSPTEARPAIQAAFCIDVRSEILRRALEATDSGVATLGFAGFFGLSATHRAMGSDTPEARAPVLLQPALQTVTDATSKADFALRIRRRAERAWGRFKMAAVSAFAFVEAAGPLYIAKLIRDARPRARTHTAEPAPRADLPLADRVAAAATVLRAMSLTRGFARLILIAGHGSKVTNAPHASALQCGACGGHAGDVNARLLAGLLNDPDVRAGLVGEGIELPRDTLFVAGLHDTVSDEVTVFDDHPAPGHAADLARLRRALASAAGMARAERALVLPRGGDGSDLARRGGDWSDLRPEWGLAGCAAFIAAPRSRSAHADLGGRAFLHDYDWQADDGFGALETILTAPVVVASWISLQYNGSALAPDVFGGGNKLIHNVVGGIGVVEGTGGLLRPGLPWQSVHDGDTLRHEATRLTVVVEAPTEAIEDILNRHPQVRALFDNGWLALMVMDAAGRITTRYDRGGWTPASPQEAQARAAA